MGNDLNFEIMLVAVPGLEAPLLDEASALFAQSMTLIQGGITFQGNWHDVWRANLYLRGASRVLARIGSFRAMHLAQLDKRARKFAWGDVLQPGIPVKVEAVCRKSRIYHAGAATQRVATALRESAGIPVSDDAELRVMVRIEDDLCTISLDTSGEALHRRGHKEAVGKAPMRETMAAMFLRDCGYDGTEAVLDPMCGSGTFVIEAAERALRLAPGRNRRFAFETLAGFDPSAWAAMRRDVPAGTTDLRFFGSDRDTGAVSMASANAERAGVAGVSDFNHASISDITPPPGAPGLVIVNPPYGARIGNPKPLLALHHSFGNVMKERFSGWRIGLVTSEPKLANATGLPFGPPGPIVAHGGLKIRLYQTDRLA